MMASCSEETLTMRYSPNHKAQTHQRIIKQASQRFRRDGIGATGLQPLMKSLGLTHGGFYAHFASKNELVEKALQHAACEVDEHCAKIFTQKHPLHTFIDTYLSDWHRACPDQGCPLPTMSAEMAQQGQPSPTTDYVIQTRLKQIQNALAAPDTEELCIVMLSTLVGALVLARGSKSAELRRRILEAARNTLKKSAPLT